VKNIPAATGDVLDDLDINFGTYDRASRNFTIDNNAIEAVHVMTDRLDANDTAVPSFLLRLVGLMNFDVRATAIYETYYPTCLREGFVAESRVDMQSGNGYKNGFCIHSNSHVEINNGNDCEPGVIISVPGYLDDFVQPNDKVTSNPGCEDAVRAGSYDIKVLDRIADIESGVTDPTSDWYRGYGNAASIVTITLDKQNNPLEFSDLPKDADGNLILQKVYNFDCTKTNAKISWGNAEVWRDIVVITNCKVDFSNSAHLVNMTLIITDDTTSSWSAPNGLTLGAVDKCDPGGEAQIVTYGGVSSASGLNLYGSQIIAAKNVDFAANADGIFGASIISGGEIDGTSGSSMAFCGNGLSNNFEAKYFRLAG